MNWEVLTMKSGTSFCNGPVLRKNLARFAPLWGGYILCLLLGTLLLVANDLQFWFAANIGQMCSGMAVVNLGYALLTRSSSVTCITAGCATPFMLCPCAGSAGLQLMCSPASSSAWYPQR